MMIRLMMMILLVTNLLFGKTIEVTYANATPEYVYIISNPSYDGLLKVGYTTREPEVRIRELFSTGVPTPFEIEKIIVVPSGTGKEIEGLIHQELDEYRVNSRREFFKIEVDDVVKALGNIEGLSIN